MSKMSQDVLAIWQKPHRHREHANPYPISYGDKLTVISWPREQEQGTHHHPDVAKRISHAIALLDSVIVVDPETRGGVPVLIHTRMPIARIFSEIAAGRSISDIADDKELDLEAIRQVFKGFAVYLGRSFSS